MTVERCPTCAEWTLSKYHKCNSVWLVAIVEGEEQPVDEAYCQVRASDEEEAAKKRAEDRDCWNADYEIMKGWSDYVAWVKAAADAKPKRFKVTGEAVPQYHAEEITVFRQSIDLDD